MTITTSFIKYGEPQIGLSPTIRIREVYRGDLIVEDGEMVEIENGDYYYNFTNYINKGAYVFRCDGGTVLPMEVRYTYLGSWEVNDLIKNDYEVK